MHGFIDDYGSSTFFEFSNGRLVSTTINIELAHYLLIGCIGHRSLWLRVPSRSTCLLFSRSYTEAPLIDTNVISTSGFQVHNERTEARLKRRDHIRFTRQRAHTRDVLILSSSDCQLDIMIHVVSEIAIGHQKFSWGRPSVTKMQKY